MTDTASYEFSYGVTGTVPGPLALGQAQTVNATLTNPISGQHTTDVGGEIAYSTAMVNITVTLAGITSTGDPVIDAGSSLFVLSNDGSLISVNSSASTYTYCFAAGTPIATPDGEVAVEDLRIGDRLLTAYGAVVLVKWVGRQTVSKLFTPAERFRPVRIAAGALGESVPHTDLVVTADHGIVFDGVVVNAGALVNGTTIVRVPAEELSDRVTYFHVETEDHHVILAAGVPAETFVDNVTRRHFDNYAEYVALYGEPGTSDSTTAASGMAELPHPRVMSRRQLPAWIAQKIAERAAALADAVPEAV